MECLHNGYTNGYGYVENKHPSEQQCSHSVNLRRLAFKYVNSQYHLKKIVNGVNWEKKHLMISLIFENVWLLTNMVVKWQ